MVVCQICNRECKSIRSLSKHLRDLHKLKSKDYYDKFIATGTPVCLVCRAPKVNFINLSSGYTTTCSHKCGGILHRKNLISDIAKDVAFRNKVAKNQTEIWENRRQNGECGRISKKISETLITKNSSLTDEEKKYKFGWMNNITLDEKEKWKQEVMANTGAHLWWKLASEIEKEDVYQKRNASRIGIPLNEYTKKIPLSKQSYYILVGLYTTKSYFNYKNEIDPYGLRGKGYHLDHKYSIIRGYYDSVPPEVIGSIFNLELLTESDNLKKNSKCSITKELLLEQYYAKF